MLNKILASHCRQRYIRFQLKWTGDVRSQVQFLFIDFTPSFFKNRAVTYGLICFFPLINRMIHSQMSYIQSNYSNSEDQSNLILAPDNLDNLEDGRTTNKEEEESQNPGTNWILFGIVLRTLWNISSEHDILRCSLIGNLHFLLSGHIDDAVPRIR